jgi:RHS repeat-associated protein
MTYDANGSLLTGRGRTITWNARRLPTQINGTQFMDDALDRRVKKVTGTSTSLYPLGDDDYEITNGVITKYIAVDGLGVIAKRVGSGVGATTYWLHTDRLGSIQAITNASGAEVQRRTYRPYGQKIADSTSHAESRGWIDQRTDDTGLTYLHARYYDPALGIFLSPDPAHPAAIGVGVNRYGYAFGDPVNATDRSGNYCVTSIHYGNPGDSDARERTSHRHTQCYFGGGGGVYEDWGDGMVPSRDPQGRNGGRGGRGGGSGNTGGGAGEDGHDGNGGNGNSGTAEGSNGNDPACWGHGANQCRAHDPWEGPDRWDGDFSSVSVNIGIPQTLGLVSWSPALTWDNYGNLYFAPFGVSVGKSFPTQASAELAIGWLELANNPDMTPTRDQLEQFLSGSSQNVSGGFLVGGGRTWNGMGRANEFGIMTPQAGWSYRYSLLLRRGRR